MEQIAAFRLCPKCGFEWETVEHFLVDQSVRVIAYEPMFSNPEEGHFFFVHEAVGCHEGFSLMVGQLAGAFRAPRGKELHFMSPECEGRCFVRHDLAPCEVECSMRWPRVILQHLREHKLPEALSDYQNYSKQTAAWSVHAAVVV